MGSLKSRIKSTTFWHSCLFFLPKNSPRSYKYLQKWQNVTKHFCVLRTWFPNQQVGGPRTCPDRNAGYTPFVARALPNCCQNSEELPPRLTKTNMRTVSIRDQLRRLLKSKASKSNIIMYLL